MVVTNKKILIISACLVIIFCIKSCIQTRDSNLKRSKDEGYYDGVKKGKSKAETEFSQELEKSKIEYEAFLQSEKNVLEQKVTAAYNEGHHKGEEKMSEDIQAAMKINTENKKTKKKKSKQNWNEIISQGGE